jgi:hypothetical protein
MKRTLVLLTLSAALLAAPSLASAATATAWKGVVVAKDVKRGTVVTASANGTVRTARSAKTGALKIGQRLDVRGVALADGTFKTLSVKIAGHAKTTRLKAVVVRNQKAQKQLLVSAGGSTFALNRGKTRALATTSQREPEPGDRINATVSVVAGAAQAVSVSTVGRLGVLEVEGILTKIAADSIELVVAKAGFVTLALPAGFALPAGIQAFDEVKVHVAVGTDGKLSLLAIQGDDADDQDDDGVDFNDDAGELEVKGTISALSATSITVTPGATASPVTCALETPLTGFAVNEFVELKCVASRSTGTLVLKKIKHEDNDDEDDDDDDDDHSGPGRGGDDGH